MSDHCENKPLRPFFNLSDPIYEGRRRGTRLAEEEPSPPPSPACPKNLPFRPPPPPASPPSSFPAMSPCGENPRSATHPRRSKVENSRSRVFNPRSTLLRRKRDPLRYYRPFRRFGGGAKLSPECDPSPEKPKTESKRPEVPRPEVPRPEVPPLPAGDSPERLDRKLFRKLPESFIKRRRLPASFYACGGVAAGMAVVAPRRVTEVAETSRRMERATGDESGEFCPYLSLFEVVLDSFSRV